MPKKENPQVRIFVCHNALANHLSGRRLDELVLPQSAHAEEVPCLGRIDPRYLLKAFEDGCDAVCLIGCPVGKCRTMDGNLRAEKRAALVRGILEEIGIEGERLFFFLREPMDEQAAKGLLKEFLSAVGALGPSELKTPREV